MILFRLDSTYLPRRIHDRAPHLLCCTAPMARLFRVVWMWMWRASGILCSYNGVAATSTAIMLVRWGVQVTTSGATAMMLYNERKQITLLRPFGFSGSPCPSYVCKARNTTICYVRQFGRSSSDLKANCIAQRNHVYIYLHPASSASSASRSLVDRDARDV